MKLDYFPQIIGLSFLALLLFGIFVYAAPQGPDTFSVGLSERLSVVANQNTAALAGNVTALVIEGRTITRYWQGYFGNVSGNIVLADSAGNNLYVWNVGAPDGEVYATRFNPVNWTNVWCANISDLENEDEAFLLVNVSSDTDTINRTFNKSEFDTFYVGSINFTNGNQHCRATAVNNTGFGASFYEVILVDGDNRTQQGEYGDSLQGPGVVNRTIYVGLIDQNVGSFRVGSNADFQLMVPEPGAGDEAYPDGTTTTYYFYVELE